MPDLVFSRSMYKRQVRATEALAAWQSGDQELARQVLADLRFDDPDGPWTRAVQRTVSGAQAVVPAAAESSRR